MSEANGSLLGEWSMLQDRIVPFLKDVAEKDGTARVWSLGEVADAVAVTAAYADGTEGHGEQVVAFSSDPGAPMYFSLGDIRGMPVRKRSSAFRRAAHGWLPTAEIAGRVILGDPVGPVDLVTLRAEAAGATRFDEAAGMLRPGGLLMLADPVARLPRRPDMHRLGRNSRLFQKRPAERPARPRAAPGGGETGLTLAARQEQADLVNSHINLARSLARRFAGHGETRQDLDQVALLALVKAAGRFEPERSVSFSTFATATILGELKRHFRDRTWMMRVPRSVQETYLAIKDTRETLSHELSRSPTIQQIAERLDISEEHVLEAMEAGENYWPESLDVGLRQGDVGRDVPVTDNSFDAVLEHHDLHTMLPRLAPRERLLLRRLYLDGWTQRQVADEIGVSQMHISRLLSRTIERMRIWGSDERFTSAS